MTSQSPRIYIYKITFEEVLYYYYGVHKEKKFGEYYMGSPTTHKWCWELYTPKKQILQLFDFTDEGWIEAQEIEKRLIRPFYNTDKWCLNESVGGIMSLKLRKEVGKRNHIEKKGVHNLPKEQRVENARKAGKIGGKVTKEKNVGLFSLTKEQQRENGKRIYSEGKGLASIPPEKRIENSKKYGVIGGKVSGKKHRENKTGVCGLTKERRMELGKKGGTKTKELGVGIFAIPPEKVQERNKKNALQRWKCLETGFVTNAGNLTQYQRARGIDTSKRIRLS